MRLALSEHRGSPRSRCLVGAQVFYNDRRLSLSCTVRNISDSGCMLVFGEDPFIPNKIEIRISNRRELMPAEVVWRKGRSIGVAFRES